MNPPNCVGWSLSLSEKLIFSVTFLGLTSGLKPLEVVPKINTTTSTNREEAIINFASKGRLNWVNCSMCDIVCFDISC